MAASQKDSGNPVKTKTVMLLRHAKSSWSDTTLRDHDRPLNRRGISACTTLAKHLTGKQVTPDLIYVSSAKRTRETIDRICELTAWTAPLEIQEDLYGASATNLLRTIQSAPAQVEKLLLVGHNPAIQDLVVSLAQRGRAQYLDQVATKYPTGAFTLITTPVYHWSDVEPGCGRIETLLLPRQLDHREKARRWG